MITRTRPRSAARWWLSTGVGTVVSMPFAWLLSHAALLPFFLGLFFFVLFGLVVGAVMHRVASGGRPYAGASLVIGTTVVVTIAWAASIVWESRDFPRKMAGEAGDKTRYIGDRTIDEYQAAVEQNIRNFLREQYPPGGTLGYAKWVLTSGQLTRGRIADVNRTLRAVQSGYVWAVRVILSVALFGFGVGSQTFLLRLPADPAVRAIDAQT